MTFFERFDILSFKKIFFLLYSPSLPLTFSLSLSIYIYTHTHIYTSLPVSDIVRLPHPRSGDSHSQDQEKFLASSAEGDPLTL